MKRHLKSLVVALSLFAMLLSLCACSGSEDESTAATNETGEVGNPFIFCDTEYSSVKELGEVKNQVNAKDIFKNLDYIPEMFYGDYGLETYKNKNPEKIEQFKKDMSYTELEIQGKPRKVTSLPFAFKAGKIATNHTIAFIPGYHWIELSFYDEAGNLQNAWAAYSIDGNKIKLNTLKEYEYIEEKHVAKYLLSDKIIEYIFEFNGTQITLSTVSGDKSVTLTSSMIIDNAFRAEAHLDAGSEPIDDIAKFDFANYIHDEGDLISHATIDFTLKDGETYAESTSNVYAQATKDGVLTFSYQKDSKDDKEQPIITHQFAYFLTGDIVDSTLILTDGENIYKYHVNDTKTTADGLGGEEVDLSSLTEAELAELNAKKDNLLEDLVKAFEDKGIKVTVNQKTGELAMDSSVLFSGDSSELSNDGKAFLNKFIDAYTSIVYSDKYAGFIAKTKVEGHTAPLAGSTYESGLPLSEARAKVVKDYCLSSDTGIDAKYTTELKSDLEDIGYSNTKPISDAKGNIDIAASRRVSFRFIVNIEK